jgi:hypothetical protein
VAVVLRTGNAALRQAGGHESTVRRIRRVGDAGFYRAALTSCKQDRQSFEFKGLAMKDL